MKKQRVIDTTGRWDEVDGEGHIILYKEEQTLIEQSWDKGMSKF